jgi:hypothetical protein
MAPGKINKTNRSSAAYEHPENCIENYFINMLSVGGFVIYIHQD